MSVSKLNLKVGVGEGFDDGTLDLNNIFLRQADSLLGCSFG